MFWVYFIVTVFGGVSLLILTSTRPFETCVRKEPEWFAMTGPLFVATALGSADMWRYAAFVVPAVAPFWAWSLADVVPRRRKWLFATVSLATVATQRPWQRMDLESYFRDWFPYYTLMRDRAPVVGPLWPTWHYHIVIAAVSLVVIALVRRWAAVPRIAPGQPQPESVATTP
jgi:hypothetical protein